MAYAKSAKVTPTYFRTRSAAIGDRGHPVITVANCFDLIEANRLRMALESVGIPVFIPDEMTASIAPHWFLSGSGVRIQVADRYAAEAQKIIEGERQEP